MMVRDSVDNMVEFISRVLELAGLDLRAYAIEADDGYKIDITGEDVAILLGHNAELLDALEYIGNRALTRMSGFEEKVPFDSGNYRASREKELQLMATKAAERVRMSRVPFVFDPLSPNERRIIHLALAEDSSVKTESIGSGDERKVKVFPS